MIIVFFLTYKTNCIGPVIQSRLPERTTDYDRNSGQLRLRKILNNGPYAAQRFRVVHVWRHWWHWFTENVGSIDVRRKFATTYKLKYIRRDKCNLVMAQRCSQYVGKS